MKLWLYESWIQDLEDKHEFAKSYAILHGSFTNPKMAGEMIKKDNPEHMSTDEDFEESWNWVVKDRKKETKKRRRRRRKI